MENFYLLLVGILILLAVSDLVIGVSNDAVNFLNSAIGSKAASFRVIMIIAALGILFGATFSSGMMDVARKGIFNPEHFFLNEIMIIFLAVMLTDIILLDLFNTFGLPTSTTVSIGEIHMISPFSRPPRTITLSFSRQRLPPLILLETRYVPGQLKSARAGPQ